MDLYLSTSQICSKVFTNAYSNSFGMASRLFSSTIRPHIYAIYGLTRLADEIVDTYKGNDSGLMLDLLEKEVSDAITRNFSVNPIVQAFAHTARSYNIDTNVITSFFNSMRTDLTKTSYTQKEYETYIHGSAEAVGLMCLCVFVNGDVEAYVEASPGAIKLGAAYQKVNFLRDFAEDHKSLGRIYFPGVTYESFDENTKIKIIKDIRADFASAALSFKLLPKNSKRAVMASYRYYSALLDKLDKTPATTIKHERIRISNARKLRLLI